MQEGQERGERGRSPQGKWSNCYILNNIPEIYDLCSVWGALSLPVSLLLSLTLSLSLSPSPSWHILPPPWAMERFPFPVAILLNAWKMLRKILMRSLRAPNGNGKWNGKDDKWLWSIINFSADWAKCEPAAQEEKERERERKGKQKGKRGKSKSHAENMHNAVRKKMWGKCRKFCHNNASSGSTSHPVRQSVSQALQVESQLFINEANLLLNLCRLHRLSLELLFFQIQLQQKRSQGKQSQSRQRKRQQERGRRRERESEAKLILVLMAGEWHECHLQCYHISIPYNPLTVAPPLPPPTPPCLGK